MGALITIRQRHQAEHVIVSDAEADAISRVHASHGGLVSALVWIAENANADPASIRDVAVNAIAAAGYEQGEALLHA